MRSLLNGKAPTPIYVADVEACRNSIRLKYGENHEDYKFFDDLLKKGYKYITIDGNNVLEVYDTIKDSATRIRKGNGPILIEALTF